MYPRTRKVRSLTAAILTFGSLVGGANGAIVLSDAGGFAQVTFTTPITFEATGSVTGGTFDPRFFGLIAEDYFTSDTAAFTGNPTSGGITTSNSASTIAPVISTNAPTLNLYDRNDLIISFDVFSDINVGDFIMFEASSFVSNISFASLPGTTNSPVSLTMVNNFNQAISASQTIAIPEPSSTILVGIGAVALAGLRRRRN